jgi:sugar/nucleoside kinase (ribokinase family)
MVALSRLELKTAVIASVGPDEIGQRSIAELKTEKVITDYMIRHQDNRPSDSAYGFIEDGTGRRTIVLCRKQKIAPRELKTETLPIPRLIHLDGRDLEACIKLAKWGRSVGATITFDIGSMRNDVSPIFKLVDHLIVSDDYARDFTGKRSVRRTIQALRNYCPGTVVVSMGTAGSIGLENGEYVKQAAFRVKTVDTTGAGDSFHAGYIYGLLKGLPLQQRMLYGAAVAAIKVQSPGARGGNPTLAQFNRFLKKRPPLYV